MEKTRCTLRSWLDARLNGHVTSRSGGKATRSLQVSRVLFGRGLSTRARIGRGQRQTDEDAERPQEREVLGGVEPCSWGRVRSEVSAVLQFGQRPLTSRSEPRTGFRQRGQEASCCRTRSATAL
ncbi:MAG: hypothetical protein H0V58_01030 [Actinobacteria bacterium]|nr:hypothetical protein [Actinomycetota bacterium]